MVYNATYCQNIPVPIITTEIQNTGSVKVSFTCTTANNVYWAYGLAGSAYLSLNQVQALIKTPLYDPINFRTVGTTVGNTYSSNALPYIKNSGEKYTLAVFCEFLGANSTATKTFNSFNNTKLETLVIGLISATALTAAQKPLVAASIATILGTTRPVWTDDDKPHYVLTKRMLQATSTAFFYILPDYNLTSDSTDANIDGWKKTIAENAAAATSFASQVGTKSSVIFTGATAVTYPSTLPSPSLVNTYPSITVTDTSFSIILKQSGAAGTLSYVYKKETVKANNTQSTITETDFAALPTASLISDSAAAVIDTNVTITVSGLAPDFSYTVYYYGQNNGLPKMKTPIYTQIITTNKAGVGILRYGFFILLAMMIVILV